MADRGLWGNRMGVVLGAPRRKIRKFVGWEGTGNECVSGYKYERD